LVVLSLLVGVGLADDPLFILGGFVPLAASLLTTAWLSHGVVRRRLLGSLAYLAVGGAVFGAIFRAIAAHEGITHTSLPVTLVPYNAILDHLGIIAQAMLEQLNGNFGRSCCFRGHGERLRLVRTPRRF
jgi:hypothetical protein